jgi:hypothetical protein
LDGLHAVWCCLDVAPACADLAADMAYEDGEKMAAEKKAAEKLEFTGLAANLRQQLFDNRLPVPPEVLEQRFGKCPFS